MHGCINQETNFQMDSKSRRFCFAKFTNFSCLFFNNYSDIKLPEYFSLNSGKVNRL